MARTKNQHLATVAETADFYSNSRSNLSHNSKLRYQAAVSKWITPVIGTIPISKLTNADVTRVIVNYQDSPPPNGQHRSPSAYWPVLVVLRSILNFALSMGLVTKLPLRIRVPQAPPKPLQSLLATEVAPFLEAVDTLSTNSQVRLAIRLMLVLGLRVAEVASLRWDMIRSENTLISLTRSTQRCLDWLPVPLFLSEMLTSFREEEVLRWDSAGIPMPPWVFSSPDGNPRFPGAAGPTIQKAANAIGLVGAWTPHHLRISCMVILHQLGVEPLAIRRLLGYQGLRSLIPNLPIPMDVLREVISRDRHPGQSHSDKS